MKSPRIYSSVPIATVGLAAKPTETSIESGGGQNKGGREQRHEGADEHPVAARVPAGIGGRADVEQAGGGRGQELRALGRFISRTRPRARRIRRDLHEGDDEH